MLSHLAFPITSPSGVTAASRHSFCDEDYQSYLDLLSEWCGAVDLKILAYCLMPNHVHLIAMPESGDGVRGSGFRISIALTAV